jgi:hypothetical protein
LLHLDRIKAVQLGRPGLLDRQPGRVIQPIGEREILPDEDDRVATEVFRKVERQVRDGAAGFQSAANRSVLLQQHVAELVVQHVRPAPVGLQNLPGRLRLGHEDAVVKVFDAVKELGRDFVEIETGDEMGVDAASQQLLEDGLNRDDDGPLAQTGELVDIAGQRRPGCDQYRRVAR